MPTSTSTPSTSVAPTATAVATSIAVTPTSISSAIPTITIGSTSTATQTVTNFSVNNCGVDLYGVQVGVSNLPTGSTSSLVCNISGWTPVTGSPQAQATSTIAIDFSNSNPVLAGSNTSMETLTVNQGSIATPIKMYTFTLTGKASDLKLSTLAYNLNITGNVGFSVPASTLSGNYSGGTGLNTLVFPDTFSNYSIQNQGNNNFSVTYNTNGAVDSVKSFSRLEFKDIGVAYDLNGAAGQVAKILGGVFGPSAITNKSFVGIGLGYLNQGMSYPNLIGLALNAALGSNFSNAAEVTLLFKNLAGVSPSAQDLNTWTTQISNGTYTQTSLAQFACDNAINTTNIKLTGLAQTGLAYA